MFEESFVEKCCHWFRVVAKWTAITLAVILLLLLGAFGILSRHAIYNRFYLFPKQAQTWKELAAQRQPVSLNMGWPEFRGIMHNHSELSHDSKVPFPTIVDACKKAQLDFIFMSDHLQDDVADFSRGWKGMHDGILFVRGYEWNEKTGFLPWGLPDDTILHMNDDLREMAARVKAAGGVAFFAHSEEPLRDWECQDITGMEIYNIHSNFKMLDMKKEAWRLIPNFIWCLRAYPEQTIRSIYFKPVSILARWDAQNRTRRFTGIAANDIHQNVGLYGVYTDKDTFRIYDTGHKDRYKADWKLNAITRPLLRLCFGPLEPNKELFRTNLDPYERSARFVNTHILAKECTEVSLLDGLRNARVFVGFDVLADARGFAFLAQDGAQKAIIGETIPFSPNVHLRAASPVPCRFVVIHDGSPEGTPTEGRDCDIAVKSPGKYRIEAELNIVGEWTPWVFTNPIEVKAP